MRPSAGRSGYGPFASRDEGSADRMRARREHAAPPRGSLNEMVNPGPGADPGLLGNTCLGFHTAMALFMEGNPTDAREYNNVINHILTIGFSLAIM